MVETFQSKNAGYEILSREIVSQLRKKFNDALEEKARKVIPQNAADQNDLLCAMRSLLIEAARKNIAFAPETLKELAAAGGAAIAQRTEEIKNRLHMNAIKDIEVPSPCLSADQMRQIEEAAAQRKNCPMEDSVFGGEERIYLRLSGTAGTPDTHREIAAYLAQKGYRVLDYTDGYAVDFEGKQKFRIGKLLKDKIELQEIFNRDSSRTGGNMLVAVSRSAMDIALMSTSRAWTSCMGSRGSNWDYVPRNVSEGALVCYLISRNDPEILNPMARILLMPFHEKRKSPGLLAWAAHRVFGRKPAETPAPLQHIYVPNKSYGLHNEAFMDAVDSFAEEKFNSGKTGRFSIAKELYADMLDRTAVRKAARAPLLQ